MRTIKELLILLREELPIRINHPKGGSLCWAIDDLYFDDTINDDEHEALNDWIDKHRPNNLGGYEHNSTPGFWWPYSELAPRLEFLDKLINEIDEN